MQINTTKQPSEPKARWGRYGVVEEDIARYRDAAARCRMLAENTLTKEAKATLLELAADFESRVAELEAEAAEARRD